MTRRLLPALLLGLALALVPAAAVANDVDAPESGADAQESGEATPEQALPGTGDDWIDARLADMDRHAARYPGAFIDEIARYLEAPRPLLAAAIDGGMRPGDVYYACALARASGRSCRSLIDAWRNDPRDGWEGVAARLDLDARDPLYPRIREDITASYRRWARPLDVATPRNP